MSDIRSISSEQLVRRVFWMACAVLLLTSVHHIYGAYIYDTPWRLHVALVSVLTAATLIGSLRVLRRRSAGVAGEIAFWVFAVVVFVIPVAGIGVFEGGYNHAVKDALYFSGASLRVMYRLFPPPAYELPNDVFFEITGVQQLVLAVVTGYFLYFLVRNRWRQRGALSRPRQKSSGPGGAEFRGSPRARRLGAPPRSARDWFRLFHQAYLNLLAKR